MTRRFLSSIFLSIFVSVLSVCVRTAAQWTAPNPVSDFQKQPDGVLVHLKVGTLRFQVCSPSILHLQYSPTADFPEHANPVVIKTSWPETRVDPAREHRCHHGRDATTQGCRRSKDRRNHLQRLRRTHACCTMIRRP